MAKDPAFLLYSADFLIGALDLSMKERGQYITLLCLQHQKGHLTSELVNILVPNVSRRTLSKFQRDPEGRLFQPRLESEIARRAQKTKTQTDNANKRWLGLPNDEFGNPKPEDFLETEIETEKRKKKKTRHALKETTVRIVAHLNATAGTRYLDTTESTRRLIASRLADGFTPEDLETVITKKWKEWAHTDMAKYMRPSTLFGEKFEGYLNQRDAAKGGQSARKQLSELELTAVRQLMGKEKA